ncbi:MAG: pyridoxamine 5'-phosphate oxidase family protein [Sphingomonadaceae bacterium]
MEARFESPFEDLDAAQAALWQRLVRAARDRRSAWHNPVVASVGLDGAPRARVMVLRHADRESGRLRLHTDIRTSKVAELAREPRVALLFYDAPARLQLRLEGLARIESQGEAADLAWAASRPFSRRCYTAPAAPGTPADGPTSGLPPELEQREPTLAESEAGRPHFAVMLVDARSLEFLHLAVTGHRRGRFCRDGDGWLGSWLIP